MPWPSSAAREVFPPAPSTGWRRYRFGQQKPWSRQSAIVQPVPRCFVSALRIPRPSQRSANTNTRVFYHLFPALPLRVLIPSYLLAALIAFKIHLPVCVKERKCCR